MKSQIGSIGLRDMPDRFLCPGTIYVPKNFNNRTERTIIRNARMIESE